MQPFPGFECLFPVLHKRVPAVEEIFESHDGDLGPSPVQASQPLRLSLAIFTEVEAGSENAEGQVWVGTKEVSHMSGTVITGAPGGEPCDAVAAAWVQVPS